MAPADSLNDEIDRLCEEGDALSDESNFQEALPLYQKAWTLVPEPKDRSPAATWILSALGDTHFYLGEYESGISALTRALHCPDGLGNPFVHLRLGQCYFETRNFDGAKAELQKAFEGAGEEIFEDEDPKYADLIRPAAKGSAQKKRP